MSLSALARVPANTWEGNVEMTDQERQLLEYLELLIRLGDSFEEAGRKLSVIALGDSQTVRRVLSIREEIANTRRHIACNTALVDPEDMPAPWYVGTQQNDRFWPSLQAHLEADQGWTAAVPSLDASSTDIVGLLADPHSPVIRTRGLVLGYVQSGKTANFTATIAKAADAGYRLFIVLSGVHNALRRQTQVRLDQQLYELNKTRWLQLTDENCDFGNPVRALALVAGTDLRLLAVVKKNVSRLTRLRDWLRAADEHGGLDTCPVLIIDDEADQASPNAAKNAELDRTKINQRIVELLQLPRVAYLGYTATPFANVLINPSDVADLYPRNFIYSLQKPPTYFGSEELFGTPQVEDDEDDRARPHDMIRTIPDEEAEYFTQQATGSVPTQVTPSLGDAIRWFLLATAARRARSGQIKHSSMLIHTTMRIDPQLQYLSVIKDLIKGWVGSYDHERDHWRTLWEAEIEREPAERHGLTRIAFDDVWRELRSVLGQVNVVADNSRSTERLIYGNDPATVIAVGGNTLSRGLTLEGLVSSFFLRSAGTYDSLLQMGRWFGYRPGYADLPRIWTTSDLAEDFRFLADVERDMRSEIQRYREENTRPSELPVKIRVHPRMQVTAKSKMQFAVPGDASYSGHRPQTTYFSHLDHSTIAQNAGAARSLLRSALAEGAQADSSTGQLTLRDVSADAILNFTDAYRFHQDTELRSHLLSRYITSQREYGALDLWNVVVVTRRPPAPTMELGLDSNVHLLTRSKLTRSSSHSTANIGTLMSRPDRVADLMSAADTVGMLDAQLLEARTASGRGLLLLYPIDKDSAPKSSALDYRSNLAASDHLIGVAYSFPRAVPGSEPTETVMVDPARLASGQEVIEEYIDDEGSRDDVDLSDV